MLAHVRRYAAILKEAEKKIYEDCGWNLGLLKSRRIPKIFGLLEMLPKLWKARISADTSTLTSAFGYPCAVPYSRNSRQIFFKDFQPAKLV